VMGQSAKDCKQSRQTQSVSECSGALKQCENRAIHNK
jgi:hypothetical protein